MTDDELERALLALPLDDVPPDVHARILAATIHRPPVALAWWELWGIATLLACGIWCIGSIVAGGSVSGDRLARAVTAAVDGFAAMLTSGTILWAGIGVAACVAVAVLHNPRRLTR